MNKHMKDIKWEEFMIDFVMSRAKKRTDKMNEQLEKISLELPDRLWELNKTEILLALQTLIKKEDYADGKKFLEANLENVFKIFVKTYILKI